MTILTDTRHSHQQFLRDLETKLLSQQISAAEFTTLCLLPELARLNIGFQKLPLVKNDKPQTSVIEFLRLYSWKGQTDRIRRSLYQWHLGNYPLVLWNRIPTPLELLKIQAEGKRVITVFNQAEDWRTTHLGKSAWEFIVHDLIHADHFFEKPEWRQGQIAFYQFILKNWNVEMLLTVRTHCSEQFDYLISDMNSHPQHMEQTLGALCLMAWKKHLQLNPKARLSSADEELFQVKLTQLLATRLLK